MEENLDDWETKRKNYLALAIVCFFIGTYFFIKVTNGSYILKNSELIKIENLVISESPIFKETKGKHGRKWIEFKCINTNATFEIASFDYKCVDDAEIIDSIKNGDTISITISNKDTGTIDKETSCEIHGLEKDKKEYLNITCRNEEDNDDGKMGYIMLFALTTMAIIVYSFSIKPKIFEKVDPQIPIWIVMILLFIILR